MKSLIFMILIIICLGIILIASADALNCSYDVSTGLTCKYNEPTKNVDGSDLLDLDHVVVYEENTITSITVPASKPTGGGIDIPVVITTPAFGKTYTLKAVNAMKVESVPSAGIVLHQPEPVR